MASEGFGIAGHKNSYSSKVRCGNWVEDEHGSHLASVKQMNRLSNVTESRHRFGPKQAMERSPLNNAKKVIGMQGLSYGLLLNHRADGKVHISPQTPYMTTHNSAFQREEPWRKPSLQDKKNLALKRQAFDCMYRTSSECSHSAPFQPQAGANGKRNGFRKGTDMSFSKTFYAGRYLSR